MTQQDQKYFRSWKQPPKDRQQEVLEALKEEKKKYPKHNTDVKRADALIKKMQECQGEQAVNQQLNKVFNL